MLISAAHFHDPYRCATIGDWRFFVENCDVTQFLSKIFCLGQNLSRLDILPYNFTRIPTDHSTMMTLKPYEINPFLN